VRGAVDAARAEVVAPGAGVAAGKALVTRTVTMCPRTIRFVTGTPLAAPFVITHTKAARVTLSGSTTVKSKTFLKTFALRLNVSANETYKASAEALTNLARISTLGYLPIGTGSLRTGKGRRSLKVTIAKKYRSSLKRKLHTKTQRKKGIKLTVAVTVTNTSGQVTRSTRRFTVKG
jgi:hypothetical protein